MQNQTNLQSLKDNTTKLSFTIVDSENKNKIFKETSIESTQNKQNICHICNKPFSTLGNMRNHIITIHQNYRPFRCIYPGCNKRYSIESRYQVHLRTHLGEKPFVCQICNKSFNEKGNLKTHLRFHSELRPFKCPQCTKCYKTKGHLKDHIEIQHDLIKKYLCKFCNKKFGRISTLKAHIRTHTGEKNFKCKLEGCNKYFAEKGNMEIHYRRHLKKLNKNEEIEKIKKKKYGKKNIVRDYEEKVKEAIDKLCDTNGNLKDNCKNSKNDISIVNNNHTNNKLNNQISLNVNTFLKNSNENLKYFNNNSTNEDYINNNNSNLNNVNNKDQNNNKNNINIAINENNFINNNIRIDYEQNFVNIEKGCQNAFGNLANFPLIQEFNQPEPLMQGNKMEDIFNKEINDINIDETRPCSNTTLCKNKKEDNIFAKEEDLFSEDKNNDNPDISIDFNQNYVFLENKPDNINEERKNFYFNYNDVNEAKNSINYQEQLRLFYKNYII